MSRRQSVVACCRRYVSKDGDLICVRIGSADLFIGMEEARGLAGALVAIAEGEDHRRIDRSCLCADLEPS